MIITINGEKIDYILETEKTVGNVVSGLTDWLEQSGMLIESVQLDGDAAPMAEGEWKEKKIDAVETLAVNAVDRREGRVIQLETARDYFLLLKNSIESGDEESLPELSAGFADLRRILPHLLDEGPDPSVLPRMDSVFAESGFPCPNREKPVDPESLAAEAEAVAALLEMRRREIADPEKQAASAAVALASMAENLDDVAVKLQTGKDKAAMETIVRLTELLQAFMRPMAWISGDEDVKKIVDDMTGILAELEEALKAGDTVLIGDLLEYEIKPRLIELPNTFSGKAVT